VGKLSPFFFNDRPFLFGLSLFTTDSVTPSVGGGCIHFSKKKNGRKNIFKHFFKNENYVLPLRVDSIAHIFRFPHFSLKGNVS
jgi:hypothetical protein